MSEQSSRRYPGPRWSLRYGSFAGIERVAVVELQRMVQEFLPYVLEVGPEVGHDLGPEQNVIVAGTPESSALIAELVKTNAISLPEDPEGYCLNCRPAPWVGKERALIIAGRGPKGLLNGVHAFGAEVLSVGAFRDWDKEPRRVVDEMDDFHITDAPAVARRGLWTWGYVIYDYRRFLDNMARLRLNLLVVWNEVVPVNAKEVIAYAHDRGIEVIWGFHWGWGLEGVSLSNAEDRARIKAQVLRTYEEQYRHLDLDGIYFQTLTEHDRRDLEGKTTAAWVTEWVNDIASALLEVRPGLDILFGLHATSIADDYVDLAGLDPRVTIMWEDAGVTPYWYTPALDLDAVAAAYHHGIADFETTLSYSKRLATFRPGTSFALVPKGFTNLDWGGEFERHGPFVLGERSREFLRRRLDARQLTWDSVNYRWFQCYPHAARFYAELLEVNPTGMTVAALVEDGMFEEAIQPSVAILAETLWNPRRAPAEILGKAMSPHYG